MRNIYTICVKLCLVFSFVGAYSVNAQTTITLGTGASATATNAFVSSSTTTNKYSLNYTIYSAADIIANGGFAGLITKLAWQKAGTGEYTTNDAQFKVYLKPVAITQHASATAENWSDVITGATLVYSSTTFSWPTGTGFKTIDLQTPFTWDGSSNIAVLVDWYRPSAPTASITWAYTTVTNANKWNIGSSAITTVDGINNNRANLQMTIEPGGACTAPPTAGSAMATPATPICTGTSVLLNVSGNTSGTGQTYQWQSASAQAGPYTNFGSSSSTPSTSVSPTATTWYRLAVTCSGLTQTSDPVQVVVNPALAGGTYTINNGMPTSGTNFNNFTDAVAALNCGINGPVVFWVEPGSGPYVEQITIPQIGGASAANNVRFLGNGATIQFAPVTGARHIIKLDGADYITLDSLEIKSTVTDFGWGIHLANGANNDSIRGCTIDLTLNTSTTTDNSVGITATNSSTDVNAEGNANNIVILNNLIKGGAQGIVLNGAAGAINAVGNKISGNTVQDFYSTGIELADNSGAIVTYNDVNRMTRSWGGSATTIVGSFYGIELNNDTKGTLVEGNRIHDTHNAAGSDQGDGSYGLYSTANDAPVGSENKFINNLIYNFNSGSGIQNGIYNSGSDNVFYYHNTIVLDNGSSTDGVARGFYQTTAATGIRFRNNIVYIARGGNGEKQALYFNTATSVIVSNNNVLYNMSSGGTVIGIGYHNSVNYPDLAAWKTANSSAYDQQSVSEDPVFMGGGDFTPSNPNLNGIGANLGVAIDINGTARSASPDPGAYEFTVAGLDADIAWVSPTMPVTAGMKTITVNITNTQTSTINSINLSYSDGTTIQSQTFTGLGLTSSNSVQLSFATQYNLSASARLRAWVNTVNGVSDNNQLNDTTAYQNLCIPMNGTYTINNNVPSSSSNFQSFTEAATQLACSGVSGPVVFWVDPGSGPYLEQVTIPQISGASAANTIRFLGNGVTIQAAAVTANRHIIRLDGADYITLDSLNIVSTATDFGWGVHLTNGANYDSIRACTIDMTTVVSTTQSNSAGIVMSGSTTSVTTDGSGSFNTIANNTIKGAYQGVIITGTTGATNATGNKITGNTIQDFYANGVELADNDGAIVSYNDIHRMNRSVGGSATTIVTTFAGVEMNSATKNSLIIGNRIHDTHTSAGTDQGDGAYGVYSTANDAAVGSENKVINNLIYNFNSGSGLQYGLYNSGSNGVFYYHNTVVLDNPASTAGNTRGFYQTTAATGIQLKNNIFYITRAGTGTKHALYFNTTTSAIVSNNNVLWVNAGGSTVGIGSFGTANAPTLASWQAVNSSAYDQQSVSEDPMFFNPSAGDFTPTTSGVNNKGTNVGVTTDILGNPRSASTPDPGAYEFSNLTAGINMRAEGLVTPTVNSAGCYSATETVTIRIRNTSESAIDFSVNPVTVNVNVTGAATQNLSHIINTGTLASDATMNVVMPVTLDMTATGDYTFNASTSVAGDANPANDAMQPVTRTKIALTAGTITGPSAICASAPVNPTLSASGFTGQTSLQWVSSASSVGGYSNIAGATTVPFTATAPTQTTYYRLVVGCAGMTDTSTVLTVIYNNPQVTGTTPASRCGTGSVTLGATGSAGATLEWYTTASGGTPIATGNTFTTPSISSTTNYYVSASLSGNTTASPVLVSEMDLGTVNDQLEIQNVSPDPVDVTGWKVVISNSYTDITSVNATIQTLSGVMTAGETKSWTDLSSAANYWGSNILWNPAQQGWAAILDNNNNLKDIVFLDWPAATIQNASITMNGTAISPSSHWTGNGVNVTTAPDGQSVSRQGNIDNNTLGDFNIIPFTIGSTNPGMNLPFSGFTCGSARTMVTATINPAASNAAGAVGTTECGSATISGTTAFTASDCDPIAIMVPSGATPVTGSVNACVTIDATVQTAPTGEPYVQRHFDITPATNAATATSTVTLFFLQSEFDAFNVAKGIYPALPANAADATGIANLRITQFNGTGTAPSNYSGTSAQVNPVDTDIVWNATANRWEVTFNVTGSGGFYVHTGNVILPVTGVELKGQQTGEVNSLSWNTTTESNNKGFEIQRSADGANFSALGFVASKAQNGNSNSTLNYHFTDTKPFAGNTYYRLKQVDKDGKTTYSNTVLLGRKVSGIMITGVYPNPAVRDLNVVVSSPKADNITFVVADLTGKVVMEVRTQVVPGDNQRQINVQALSAGTYILKAVCANGCESAVQRFVKQ